MTDWFRSWHGAPSDQKWRLVARRASVRPGEVWSVISYLWDRASQAEERGSIAGFDCELIAEVFGYETGEVERIMLALADKGVIVGDRIAAWEKYQPKREDGGAERAKAWREQKRTHPNAPERERSLESEAEVEKIEQPLAQQPTAARGRADLDRLESACREAAGLESDPSPGLLSLAPIIGLLEAGHDLELDVLPTIRAVAARGGRRPRSWDYFVEAIRDSSARRRGIAASGLTPANERAPPLAGSVPSLPDVFHVFGQAADERERQKPAGSGGLGAAIPHLPFVRAG